MVKLVHHEHEEVFAGPAMGFDERLVEQEFRRIPAGHAGGFNRIREADAEEREERRQLERTGRNDVEDPRDDLFLVGHVRTAGLKYFAGKAIRSA